MAEEFTADIPPQGPWLKFQQQKPAAPEGPWTKYQAPAAGNAAAATATPDGFFTRFLNGLSGKDVSRAGRVGMGVADPFYGGAQIGARMEAQPGGGVPEATPGLAFGAAQPDRTKEVDTAVQQREAGYQQREKATGLSGGIGSEWARLLGNVVGQTPLAAVGGAVAPASAAGRIGLSAGLGAASGAMSPVAGKDFGSEKAKQVGLGAAGGAVAGVAAEGIGSLLGRAIASNDPNAVTAAFRRTVKPSRTGQASASQLGTQDYRILTAVDQIIESTKASGGQLPKSLREFAEAIDNAKTPIFRKFDAMAQAAEGGGAKVDLAPVVQQLRDVAKRPEIVDFHPGLAQEAEQLALNFERRGTYSASEAQGVIKNLNETLKGFYKNPTNDTVSRASLLGPVVKTLREGLDAAITSSQGPGYQVLKNQYGALASIEKDVAGAVQREANKIPGGIGGVFMDAASSEEALRGIITLNPGALVRAGGIKAAQGVLKYINNPNRAIEQMFRARAASGSLPSAIMSAASPALRPLGAIAGAQTTNQQQPLEFPSMPAPR